MRNRIAACFTALILGAAVPARADLITLDADNFALGTDLTSVLTGASAAFLSQSGLAAQPYNPRVVTGLTTVASYTGAAAQGFGRASMIDRYMACYNRSQLSLATSDCQYGVVEVTFDGGTDFVQLDARWLSDMPGVVAYNAAGQQVASCFGDAGCASPAVYEPGHLSTSTVTLAREQRDIARVVFGGIQGNAEISGLRYSVPEPGTLALLGMGFAGLAASRRRRRQPAGR